MTYKTIYNTIVKKVDVAELEKVLSAMHHITELSPQSFCVLCGALEEVRAKNTTLKAKDLLKKAKFELATQIYF